MFGLKLSIMNDENDFGGGGVVKLADDETIKKVTSKSIVHVEERNEVFDKKTRVFLRVLKPVILLVIMGAIVNVTVKNIIGVDKFVDFCENFVKLMLS